MIAELNAYPLRKKWVTDVVTYSWRSDLRWTAYPLRKKWVVDVVTYAQVFQTCWPQSSTYPLRKKWVVDVVACNGNFKTECPVRNSKAGTSGPTSDEVGMSCRKLV